VKQIPFLLVELKFVIPPSAEPKETLLDVVKVSAGARIRWKIIFFPAQLPRTLARFLE